MSHLLPEQCAHFSDLFDQLGLSSRPADIADFINRHRPLKGQVLLADAPFWSTGQAQFLREEMQRDEPPWSELIDQLNTALRAAPGTHTPPQRYAARSAIVGEDTPIRRALPNAARRTVGAWCFLDHAGPVQFKPGHGMHVGAHPHIGLQTFTWMIEGEVMHRDSLGNEQVVRPGQVNLMTAGRGISHTEDSVTDGARLHAAQLWIALPDSQRHCEPDFCNYPDLPKVQADGFTATVLAGTALGQTAPTQVHSDLVGIDLASEGSAHTTLPLDARFEYAVLVLRGEIVVEGEVLRQEELLYFAPGRHELSIQADGAAQVLLLGGLPFGEEILLWWNFVARNQAEMEQALADWSASPNQGGRFGKVRAGSSAAPLDTPSLEGMRLKARR